MLEGALNVACSGALPIGITDCLNFGSPETDLGAWQLERAIVGIADACRELGLPVVSGNVSLYNETPQGPILPTPVIGTVGILEERDTAVGMAWSDGDEVWLLGDVAADDNALAASELAWRRAARGGVPSLDVAAAARVVRLLPTLAASGLLTAAHDCSVGGVALALARMAIASGLGADVALAAGASTPTAVAFGERGGRAVVGVAPERSAGLETAAADAGVPATRLGVVGGARLVARFGSSPAIDVAVVELARAWRTAF